jgi:Leucine-rich repeat (LRR) protein
MKTKLLYIVFFLISFTSVSQTTYVPDDAFEQFLIDAQYDTAPLDDYVPTANIENIVFLELQFLGIADLTGIEDFSALEILRCDYLLLTSLDLSQNTALEYLECIDNQITSLDLSQNTALTTLDCSLNELSTLDLSQNVLLTNLSCSNNNLSNLNLSQNTALTSLSCGFNQLTNLNLSQNSDLVFLDCNDNQLANLNLVQNPLLRNLNCFNNQLTSLDISQNSELIFLYCYNNNFSELNLSQNSALSQLVCYDNQITNLDLTQNASLAVLNCGTNSLTALDVKNGNNTIINTFRTIGNPNLNCINVDSEAYSTANWTNIDVQSFFSEDCANLSTDSDVWAGFSMYPNPTFNILTININDKASYSIFNLNGQNLKNGELNAGENSLKLAELSKGLYILILKTDQGIILKKILKQ